MGRQIAIAQSVTDERELQAFLRRDGELFCLPRISTSSIPEPKLFGDSDAQEQIIFPAVLQEVVLKSWRRLEPRRWLGETEADALGYSSYTSQSTRAASIEWIRTGRLGEDHVRGRFYLDTGEATHGTSHVSRRDMFTVQRLFNRIVSRIRRTYPLRSSERHPTYIGPDLSEQIRSRKTRLIYAGGSLAAVLPNEHTR